MISGPLEKIARGALLIGAFSLASCAETKPLPRASKELAVDIAEKEQRKYENLLPDYEINTIVNNKDAIYLAYLKCYAEPDAQVNKVYGILKELFAGYQFKEQHPNISKESHGAKTYLERFGDDFDMMMGTMAAKEKTRRRGEEFKSIFNHGEHDDQIDKRIKELQKNMQQSRKNIAMAHAIIKYLDEEGEEAIDSNITELDDEGIENLYNLCQEKKEKEEREYWDNFAKVIRGIMLQ